MIQFIWLSLALLTIWYSIILIQDLIKHKNSLENVSWLKTGVIGFVVNFFDVLGIGAFAPQTALLKFTKQTEDRLLPGTLNVAIVNAIPTTTTLTASGGGTYRWSTGATTASIAVAQAATYTVIVG